MLNSASVAYPTGGAANCADAAVGPGLTQPADARLGQFRGPSGRCYEVVRPLVAANGGSSAAGSDAGCWQTSCSAAGGVTVQLRLQGTTIPVACPPGAWMGRLSTLLLVCAVHHGDMCIWVDGEMQNAHQHQAIARQVVAARRQEAAQPGYPVCGAFAPRLRTAAAAALPHWRKLWPTLTALPPPLPLMPTQPNGTQARS